MKVKTTLTFDVSPDAVHGHVARIVVSGKERGTVEIPQGKNTIEIVSNHNPDDQSKSDHVLVLLAAIDANRATSKARAYEYITSGKAIPRPPENVVMSSVIAVQEEEGKGGERIMVVGHPDLFDGSIGIEPKLVDGGQNPLFPKGVEATFQPETFRAGAKEPARIKLFPGDPSIRVTVMEENGTNKTLEDYFK